MLDLGSPGPGGVRMMSACGSERGLSVQHQHDLGGVLGVGRVPDDEILGVLGGVFPMSRYESERRVSYFEPRQGHALDIVFGKDGQIASCEAGPDLTRELVATLRERCEASFNENASYEVARAVLFSAPEVKGSWRHRDEWQILPAPDDAPRPDDPGGEYPFVLEYRIQASANGRVASTRRRRREHAIHLLLSLLLRGQITREQTSRPQHWMILPEATDDGLYTAYLNEGYMVGAGFATRADELSDPTHVRRARVGARWRVLRRSVPARPDHCSLVTRRLLRRVRECRPTNARPTARSLLLVRRRLPIMGHVEVAQFHFRNQCHRSALPARADWPHLPNM
jgi:hypothetical protein